jgi:hypothetical protein
MVMKNLLFAKMLIRFVSNYAQCSVATFFYSIAKSLCNALNLFFIRSS